MWTKEQQGKFLQAAARAGFEDEEEMCRILQVKSLAECRDTLGAALNKLQKARKETPTMAVATLPDDQVQDLYATPELYALGQAARAIAPWANDKNYPMTDLEIALTIRKGASLGVDVLNPHETQIWKDKRGIHFQLAYTLMAHWASHTLHGHTQPLYIPLTKEEKEAEGIPVDDHACRCAFIMKDDIRLIGTMMQSGWTAQEARSELTLIGLGTVSAQDWGNKHFAPNARSKRWKLEKRAYTDAIRRRFGTPLRGAIEGLRRATGQDKIAVEDWAAIGGGYKGDSAVEVAKLAARNRMNKGEIAAMSEEEVEGVLVESRNLLHGEPEEADWDANLTEKALPEIVADPVTGEIIGSDPDDEQPKKAPKPKPESSKHHSADPVTGELVRADDSRPHAPNVLHAKILESISKRRAAGFRFPAGKLKDFQGAVRGNLEACFAGDKNSTDRRRLVAEYLVGEPSSKKWDDAQTKALHRWLNAKPDDGGNWTPSAMAIREAVAVAREAAKEAGQTEMELEEPMRTFTRVELLAQWEKAINDARALNLPHDPLTTADATTEELAAAIDRLTVEIVAEEGKINLE